MKKLYYVLSRLTMVIALAWGVLFWYPNVLTNWVGIPADLRWFVMWWAAAVEVFVFVVLIVIETWSLPRARIADDPTKREALLSATGAILALLPLSDLGVFQAQLGPSVFETISNLPEGSKLLAGALHLAVQAIGVSIFVYARHLRSKRLYGRGPMIQAKIRRREALRRP